MPDIQFLVIEMDGGNDPVFVATNIKNIKITNFVSGVERGLYISKVDERTRLNDLAPCLQWLVGCRVDRRKIEKSFIGYNSHKFIISQFEILARFLYRGRNPLRRTQIGVFIFNYYVDRRKASASNCKLGIN